jgi:hypothetical protein
MSLPTSLTRDLKFRADPRPRPPEIPFAETLYNRPRAAPPFLHLAYENKFFKVFEFPDDIRLGN